MSAARADDASSDATEARPPEGFARAAAGTLLDWLGIEVISIAPEDALGRLVTDRRHANPNATISGGCLVAFADLICGTACRFSLPDGVTGFVTSELKMNFIGAAAIGDTLLCRAHCLHSGRLS